ncbi:hypothetical protein BGZ83_000683, partial [Gryganskiella cystojenkinii]
MALDLVLDMMDFHDPAEEDDGARPWACVTALETLSVVIHVGDEPRSDVGNHMKTPMTEAEKADHCRVYGQLGALVALKTLTLT